MYRKSYTAKTEIDKTEHTVTAVISTAAVDRENEVLLPGGGDFEQYRLNPTVLWAHSYSSMPIGKAMWIKHNKHENAIVAKARFALTARGTEAWQLYRDGYLNAFSVGFRPLEYHAPTPTEIKSKPEWAEATRIYDKWELLEFSAVPVPANPEALAIAVKGGKIQICSKVQKLLGVAVAEPEPVVFDVRPAKYEILGVVNRGPRTPREIQIARMQGKMFLD